MAKHHINRGEVLFVSERVDCALRERSRENLPNPFVVPPIHDVALLFASADEIAEPA